MTDTAPDNLQPPDDAVSGGGPGSATDAMRSDPVWRAAMQLQLLSPEAREQVLAKMDQRIAEKLRMHLESMPERSGSTDVAEQRRMLREMAERMTARRTVQAERALGDTTGSPAPASPARGAHQMQAQAPEPVTSTDPLDRLRTLHPAAIARAMQGERAEAWSIVLDRLDTNAKAALQLYLDGSARAAIDEARMRQAELAASSPALLSTIEAAIARTVVPRAMREHHQLLSTTPMMAGEASWSGAAGATA